MAHVAGLPAPTFDLDSWVGNYSGPLQPLRLSHIAAHCPPLAHQALSLALAAAKNGKDVRLYNNLTDLAARLGFRDLQAKDNEWISRQEDANRRELARLEQELKGYKNNLIRESIRMGQEDLANHHLLTGGPAPQSPADAELPQSANNFGLSAAYAAFAKMRDFCTTPTHVASMTLRLLLTASLQAVSAQQNGTSSTGHYNAMLANSNRLRSVGAKDEEMARITPVVAASAAVANLGLSNYKEAAQTFLTVPFDLTSAPPGQGIDFTRNIASGNDIAIYGGLTALATLSREDLTTKVLGGPFRAFLELEPHMRKAISLYTTAKYRACLDTLQRYHADWSLDVFLGAGTGTSLGSHVDRIFARIREKSIVSYFSSFSQVSLASLLDTFPPPPVPSVSAQQVLEDELVGLINSSALNARLDLVNGLLMSPSAELRAKTHVDAAIAAKEVERTLLLRLHRVNVALAGLEVVGTRKNAAGFEERRPEWARGY